MIEEYSFGFIKIDGTTYNYDVQIGVDGKVGLWWRSWSHEVWKKDVEEVLGQEPEAIVIGTGEMGAAKVGENTQREIRAKGIKLVIEPSGEAMKVFNSFKSENKKVAGLFHLTC